MSQNKVLKSNDVILGDQIVSKELFDVAMRMNDAAENSNIGSTVVDVSNTIIIPCTAIYSYCMTNATFPVVLPKEGRTKASPSEEAQTEVFGLIEKEINFRVRGPRPKDGDSDDDASPFINLYEIFDYDRMFICYDKDKNWKCLGEHFIDSANHDFTKLTLGNNYKTPKLWHLFKNHHNNQEIWLMEAKAFLESPTHTVSFVKIVWEEERWKFKTVA